MLRFRNAICYWPYPFNGDRQDGVIVTARDHSQDVIMEYSGSYLCTLVMSNRMNSISALSRISEALRAEILVRGGEGRGAGRSALEAGMQILNLGISQIACNCLNPLTA